MKKSRNEPRAVWGKLDWVEKTARESTRLVKKKIETTKKGE